nr:U3 small nucleolar RNA-associated protein 18 [Cryptococcus depauperatus CBS 7841]
MARNKKKSHKAVNQAPIERKEIVHGWEKDEEELELEEALFGRSKKRVKVTAHDDSQDGMSDVDDSDLFVVDAPLASQFQVDLKGDTLPGETFESDSESDSDTSQTSEGMNEFRADSSSASSDNNGHVDSDDEEYGKNRPTIHVPEDIIDLDEISRQESSRNKKKPIWHDPADELVGVDISESRRLKKIERGKRKLNASEVVVGKDLERRLREQQVLFETLHPPPEWSKNRSFVGTPSLSSLLTSTKSFVAPSISSIIHGQQAALPQGTLDLKRMRNANQANPTIGKRDAEGGNGGVVDFAWHPVKTVSVMAVAGGDRRIRFFNVDGHSNLSLLTLHIPSLPLSRSTFHPLGTSLLLTGNRPFYYTYDLAAQRCIRSPRNLWGSKTIGSAPNSLHRHTFSPNGSLLAVAGRRGAVSVLEWGHSGAGAVVAELRSGRGGSITDLVFSSDGKELSVLGGRDGADIEIWDIGERQVKGAWRDDRALGGVVLERSNDGQYTAVGSTTGIVSLYSTQSLSPAQSTSIPYHLTPSPIKSLEHLTTPITSLSFHPSSQILCSASLTRKDQLKLYHLPSGTAFSNWPTPNTPLGRVTSTGFSSGGEWLGVGNQKGMVLLWSLRHYA